MTLDRAGASGGKPALAIEPSGPRAAARRWRWPALLALTVAVLAAAVVVAVADRPGAASGPSTLAPVPVVSAAEASGTLSLGRDCGYSAPLPADPGDSLWLFCDTPVYAQKAHGGGWKLQRFIAGSTAGVGATVDGPAPSSRMPGTLSEVRTPRVAVSAAGAAATSASAPGPAGEGKTSAAPAAFLPAPADLFTSAGLPCGLGNGSYAVSWISGVARVPSAPYLLITFNDYCVLGSSGGFLPEGFGLAEYDPALDTLSGAATVFYGTDGSLGAAPGPLGSPVFSGRYLYLFGPTCSAPVSGQCAGTVLEARVAASPQAWTDPLGYQWRSAGPSGSWTTDAAAAAALIPGPKPTGLSVAGFAPAGRRLVLVAQTGIGGSFTVYQSPSPSGTWSAVRSGRVACQVGRGYANFCRALIAHPELSTAAQLVLSYFDPADGPGGHVMVEGFTW
jgi:hypothetical protein